MYQTGSFNNLIYEDLKYTLSDGVTKVKDDGIGFEVNEIYSFLTSRGIFPLSLDFPATPWNLLPWRPYPSI